MISQALISPKGVIGKVIADNDIRTEDVRVADISAWIGEAIEKIGAYKQYTNNVTDKHFDNYTCQLPEGLYRLSQIAYSIDGINWLPMVVGSSPYNSEDFDGLAGDLYVHDNEYIKLIKILYDITETELALQILNSEPNIRATLEALLQQQNYQIRGSDKFIAGMLKYEVQNSTVKLNIKSGFLRIAYLGMQKDEDGLPMIPDMDEYREALYRYCTMKLYYPKYVNGSLNANVYQDMQSNWAWARNGAYAAAMMPRVDDLEAIKNNWVRLFPETEAHSDFFTTLGDKQIIYNQ